MNISMFKKKCLECGKEVFVIKKTDKIFCSKQCESNYLYRKRFIQSPKDKQKTAEEVKKL